MTRLRILRYREPEDAVEAGYFATHDLPLAFELSGAIARPDPVSKIAPLNEKAVAVVWDFFEFHNEWLLNSLLVPSQRVSVQPKRLSHRFLRIL